MINLFHINQPIIDTSKFNHMLHGSVVREFEESIAEYTGAKYAVTVNSATNAIFLIFKYLHPMREVGIPSLIPHVVGNALKHAGKDIVFTDFHGWVGGIYLFQTQTSNYITDAAHSVNRNMMLPGAFDMTILSHFPTKPVGGQDGGTILLNDKGNADFLRELTMNGEKMGANSWERKFHHVGYKCYMNSSQAYIALQSLHHLDEKKEILSGIRELYNQTFSLHNTSDHLYRVRVKDNRACVAAAKEAGITCGIHYEPLHLHPLFSTGQKLPLSEEAGRTMVSIPFHEKLAKADQMKVVEFIKSYQDV